MFWGGKVALLLFVFIWLRGTLPRFRYDQLMDFGWKVLIPVAAVWILVTATVVALAGLVARWTRSSSTPRPLLAVVSALVVIGQKNPIYSAFALIVDALLALRDLRACSARPSSPRCR